MVRMCGQTHLFHQREGVEHQDPLSHGARCIQLMFWRHWYHLNEPIESLLTLTTPFDLNWEVH